MIPQVDRGLALRLERVLLRGRVQRGERVPLDVLWAFERTCRWAPREHGRVIVELCWALDREGETRRALDLLALERPTGVLSLDVQLEATRAFLMFAESPEWGTRALHAAADVADGFGQRAWSADLRAYAAVFAWLGGDSVALESHRSSMLGPWIEVLLEGPGADTSQLKRSHGIACAWLWSGILDPEDDIELQRTRDGRILRTVLRSRHMPQPAES